MNLLLWMLVQWTSKRCPFHISKILWGAGTLWDWDIGDSLSLITMWNCMLYGYRDVRVLIEGQVHTVEEEFTLYQENIHALKDNKIHFLMLRYLFMEVGLIRALFINGSAWLEIWLQINVTYMLSPTCSPWSWITPCERSLKVVDPICSLKMWDWINIMVCRCK